MDSIGMLLKDGGIAAALIAVIYLFITFLAKEREANRLERGEAMKIMTNHLEHTVTTQKETSEMNRSSMESLVTAIGRLCEYIQRK
jgi:hypothetical protein